MTTLSRRFKEVETRADASLATLGRKSGTLRPEVQDDLMAAWKFTSELPTWRRLLTTRQTTRKLMQDLEVNAAADGEVEFAGVFTPFAVARQVLVQSHIGSTWALCDRVAAAAGRVLAVPSCGRNESSPAQFVQTFVGPRRSKVVASGLLESTRGCFGWPVGLSYAIRNHFVHDAAQSDGIGFFAGSDSKDGFDCSATGWQLIERTAKQKYGVDESCALAGVTIPGGTRTDLREILLVCDEQLDLALGVLISTTTYGLAAHIDLILGEV